MAKTKSLSPLDMAFFVLENEKRMCNVGPLAILKPPPGTPSAAKFADKLLASMLKRPVGTPFNYQYVPPGLSGMPHLKEVDVDLAKHCHRLTMDAPGTDEQLFEMVCRVHEVRLDRSRPPWAMYVIDGLQDGRIALYAKVNHGLIDGRGFVEVFTRWFSPDPANKTARAMWEGLPTPKSDKSKAAIPAGPWDTSTLITSAARTAKTVRSLYSALGRQASASMGLTKGMPLPFVATPSVLRGKPSLRRSFAYCVLPLADMKGFGKAFDASINDVLLAVLDMAVNRYLGDGDAGARKPLVADMPVALAKAGEGGGGGGNAIAILQFPLGQTDAKPLDRLAQIIARTQEVKDYVSQTDNAALVTYTAAVHSVPAVLELIGMEHRVPMLANMLISNPFGMPQRCYLAQAELEMALPVSVLAPGQTLNITAVTYDKGLQVAFMALESEIPDVQKLSDYAVDALKQLIQAGSKPVPTKKPATVKPAGIKPKTLKQKP